MLLEAATLRDADAADADNGDDVQMSSSVERTWRHLSTIGEIRRRQV